MRKLHSHRTNLFVMTICFAAIIVVLFLCRAPYSRRAAPKRLRLIEAGYTNGHHSLIYNHSITEVNITFLGFEVFADIWYAEGLPLKGLQLSQVLGKKAGVVPIGDLMYWIEIVNRKAEKIAIYITEEPMTIEGFEATPFSIGLLPESSFTIEGSHGRESETIGLASIETEPHGGGRCQVEISHGAVAGLSIKHRPAKRPSLLTLKAGESTVISEVYALELVRVVPWDEARSFGDWAEFRVIDLRNGLPADAELPENVRSEM